MPPACTIVVRMKSISRPSIRRLQSQIELKTSPTASGVTEWRRMSSKAVRVVGRRRILQPEEPVRLEVARQTRSLDGRQPVMHVVQQLDLPPWSARSRSKSFGTISR